MLFEDERLLFCSHCDPLFFPKEEREQRRREDNHYTDPLLEDDEDYGNSSQSPRLTSNRYSFFRLSRLDEVDQHLQAQKNEKENKMHRYEAQRIFSFERVLKKHHIIEVEMNLLQYHSDGSIITTEEFHRSILEPYHAMHHPQQKVNVSYYNYVVGIVNPFSGENSAAKTVIQRMADEFFENRVLKIEKAIFADPTALREFIKIHAVIYHHDSNNHHEMNSHKRGTVIVSGGDGTIAFVMGQLELVRQELQDEFFSFPCEEAYGTSTKYYTLPALAPIPQGTGNDYSNCVGFGKGFYHLRDNSELVVDHSNNNNNSNNSNGSDAPASMFGSFSFQHIQKKLPLANLFHIKNKKVKNLEEYLQLACQGPCVPFDRWKLEIIPLPLLRESVKKGMRDSEKIEHTKHLNMENLSNFIHYVDWASLSRAHADEIKTVSVINYIGIGFDAYVACRFDETRKKYPKLCSSRTQNFLVYGAMGIEGSMKVQPIKKYIPLLCTPLKNISSVNHGGQKNTQKEEMVNLELPDVTKALVVTNVDRYSAGAQPWDDTQGPSYFKTRTSSQFDLSDTADHSYHNLAYFPFSPVQVQAEPSEQPDTTNNTNHHHSNSYNHHHPPPPPEDFYSPVSINDQRFELQAMGGVLHYAGLGLGLEKSIKIAQLSELFLFVRCTPDDLIAATVNNNNITLDEDPMALASLSVQVDGEALAPLGEPAVLRLSPLTDPRNRLQVRCYNPKVVRVDHAYGGETQ